MTSREPQNSRPFYLSINLDLFGNTDQKTQIYSEWNVGWKVWLNNGHLLFVSGLRSQWDRVFDTFLLSVSNESQQTDGKLLMELPSNGRRSRNTTGSHRKKPPQRNTIQREPTLIQGSSFWSPNACTRVYQITERDENELGLLLLETQCSGMHVLIVAMCIVWECVDFVLSRFYRIKSF